MEIQSLPMLNIGIFGHIDHGKTTLLYRLTGKWADTHSEELKRGITIKLGYADLLLRKCENGHYTIKEKCECGSKAEPIRYISFIDAPGHEMLMATTLSGAAIIDAAILVIAANEGIKPQTREHFIALQARGIKNIIIVQNKIDLVTKDEALANYREIKEFVKGTIAENSPIIPISAQQGVNVEKLLEAIANLPVPQRNTEGKPIFLIARSFDINKPGTSLADMHGGVLGGVLKQGKLKIGEEIEIKPGLTIKKANQTYYQTVKTKIKALYRGKYRIEEALPGGSLAIETELDPSLTQADALSGSVASHTAKLPEISDKLKIKASLFEKIIGMEQETAVEPIKMNEMLLLNVNTSITVGQVVKLKDQEVTLALRIPVVPLVGENVGIARNINGHWRLIGYGEILPLD